MANVIDYFAHVERAKKRVRTQVDPELIAVHIARTLRHYGGEAHRDIIINHIGRELGFNDRLLPTDVVQDLNTAFDRCCARHDGEAHDRLFRRPFGPGTHRWALARGADALEL